MALAEIRGKLGTCLFCYDGAQLFARWRRKHTEINHLPRFGREQCIRNTTAKALRQPLKKKFKPGLATGSPPQRTNLLVTLASAAFVAFVINPGPTTNGFKISDIRLGCMILGTFLQ